MTVGVALALSLALAKPAICTELSDQAILSALCPPASTCTVTTQKTVGTDPAGNTLVVAAVEQAAVCPADDSEEQERKEPCPQVTYGLLHVRGQAVVKAEEIVTYGGEDGCEYGAAGGGEYVEIKGDTAEHFIYGGSAWKWGQKETWRVSPQLQEIAEETSGWYSLGPNYEHKTTDLVRNVTKMEWYVPSCGPAEEDESNSIGGMGDENYFYTQLPTVEPACVRDWKAPDLGLPWLVVTSAGGDGYLCFGKEGGAKDARFRVVKVGKRLLIVELADPNMVTGSANWVSEDHFEIWTGGALPNYMNGCRQDGNSRRPATGLQQWGIRLTGEVLPGFGRPNEKPLVEHVTVATNDWGEVVRLRIEMPFEPRSFSLVYSDTDDGKHQKRLIGTSKVRFGDPLSLGAWEPTPP